jgi:hypothetical protein
MTGSTMNVLMTLQTALVGVSALSSFLHEAEPPVDWNLSVASRQQANVKLSLDLMPNPIGLSRHG